MPVPSANIATNKFSVKERWLKLYRKIHNVFLKFEFVHVDDYILMLQQLNTRMSTIEANMAIGDAAVATGATTAVATLNAAVTSQILALQAQTQVHTHLQVIPATPAGTGPVAPTPTLPVIPPPPSPIVPAPPVPTTGIVPYTDLALKAADAALQATGPAVAPLADGVSVEAQKASVQSLSDVGI